MVSRDSDAFLAEKTGVYKLQAAFSALKVKLHVGIRPSFIA